MLSGNFKKKKEELEFNYLKEHHGKELAQK
jgi:hypothetical protein